MEDPFFRARSTFKIKLFGIMQIPSEALKDELLRMLWESATRRPWKYRGSDATNMLRISRPRITFATTKDASLKAHLRLDGMIAPRQVVAYTSWVEGTMAQAFVDSLQASEVATGAESVGCWVTTRYSRVTLVRPLPRILR